MQNNIKIEFTFKNVPDYVLSVIKKAEIKIVEGNIDIEYDSRIHNEVFANICSLYKIHELETSGILQEAVNKAAKKYLEEATEEIAQVVYEHHIKSKLN